jgi:hypothetical protein
MAGRIIVPLTSSGSGITVTATQSAGAINATNVTAGGSGYIPGSTVTFSVTGSGGGTGAILTGTIGSNGSLATGSSSLTITAAGSAYSGTITVGAPQFSPQGGAVNITATGPLQSTTGVDISNTTYPQMSTSTITVCIEVLSLTAAKTLALSLELSVNAFAASVMAWTQEFIGQEGQGGTAYVQGTYNPTTDKRSVVVRQQLPFAAVTYFGVSSAVARINCVGIDSAAEAVVNAWLEVS